MAKPKVSAAMRRAISFGVLSKPKNSKRTTWDGIRYNTVSDRVVTTLVMLGYYRAETSKPGYYHKNIYIMPDTDYLFATVHWTDISVERTEKTCCPACGNVFQFDEGRAAMKGRKS